MDLSSYLASPRREIVHMCRVASADDYARLFDAAGAARVVGECSTYYLSSGVAPKNIHAYNPAAKILVLVRDPIDRIRSHYLMDRSLGVVSRPLLSLVEEELALGERASWGNCRFYVGASRYSRQLARFHRYFPAESVHVVAFEKLVADPQTQLEGVFSFLGIAPPVEPLVLPRENKSQPARFPGLHGALRESRLKPVIAGLLKNNVASQLARVAKSAYYSNGTGLVSPHELATISRLLREEGLDLPTADAA